MTSKKSIADTFKERLKTLTNSQQSIQSVSLWVLYHNKKASELVNVWKNHLYDSPTKQILVLIYLANDVLQNSRRRTSVFTDEFKAVFPDIMKYCYEKVDDKTTNRIERVLNIWKERKVFTGSFVDDLKNLKNSVKYKDKNKNNSIIIDDDDDDDDDENMIHTPPSLIDGSNYNLMNLNMNILPPPKLLTSNDLSSTTVGRIESPTLISNRNIITENENLPNDDEEEDDDENEEDELVRSIKRSRRIERKCENNRSTVKDIVELRDQFDKEIRFDGYDLPNLDIAELRGMQKDVDGYKEKYDRLYESFEEQKVICDRLVDSLQEELDKQRMKKQTLDGLGEFWKDGTPKINNFLSDVNHVISAKEINEFNDFSSYDDEDGFLSSKKTSKKRTFSELEGFDDDVGMSRSKKRKLNEDNDGLLGGEELQSDLEISPTDLLNSDEGSDTNYLTDFFSLVEKEKGNPNPPL